MRLEDKTVLITGAAGAIGKAIASAFCGEGARVFITDINHDGLNGAIDEISSKYGSCQGLGADGTQADQVAQVVASASNVFEGRLDILVNVAGIVGQGKVEDLGEEEWDKMFAVNCRASFLFIKNVVPLMKSHKFGKIINFSSKSGKTGSALMSHYSAAKAAIIGLTQALAHELAADGITVNCLCPGITESTGVWQHVSAGYIENLGMNRDDVVSKFTAKVPLGRLARVEDVVALTLFLASPGADYMTGQAVNITGGREMH